MGSSPLRHTLALLLALAAAVCVSHSASLKFSPSTRMPTLLGKIPFEEAGFCSLVKQPSAGDHKYDLILSSFGIFSSDVAVVKDVGRLLKNVSSIKPTSLNKEMKWPNAISGVPRQALGGKTSYIAIPDGFLVPGKEEGSVTLQPLDGSKAHVISSAHGTWFYHRVLWADMDKDGRLDALTCGANKPIFEDAKGELVFFSNPKDHSLSVPWKTNKIANGPDVLFTLVNVTVPGEAAPKEVIVTAEYFNPRLRIFWTECPKQDWSNPDMIKFRDIDTITPEMGAPFDVVVTDFNMNGKPDIVLSLNRNTNGSVVVYEMPDDFRTGTFKRHLIASGYKAVVSGPNSGAPGLVLPIFSTDNIKPSLLVSGDDNGVLSMLVPTKPRDPHDWHYKRTDFLTTKESRVGGMALADVDGDGTVELFANSYGEGQVYVYRL